MAITAARSSYDRKPRSPTTRSPGFSSGHKWRGSGTIEVAVNPKTNTIYAANLFSDTVSVISGRTSTVVATVPVGVGPSGVAANPKTGNVYVTNLIDNTVSVLSCRRR